MPSDTRHNRRAAKRGGRERCFLNSMSVSVFYRRRFRKKKNDKKNGSRT